MKSVSAYAADGMSAACKDGKNTLSGVGGVRQQLAKLLRLALRSMHQGGFVRAGGVVLSKAGGWRLGVIGVLAVLLSACASHSEQKIPLQESFDSSATFSRGFDATPARTCEAARRALLSQGYIATAKTQELIEGRKNFQPNPETNLEINFRVVCVPQTSDGQVSLGFATALQDRYALKKSASSASVGVGALGSLSLPFASSSDSLVKVGSETVAVRSFYDSFFELVESYLKQDKETP